MDATKKFCFLFDLFKLRFVSYTPSWNVAIRSTWPLSKYCDVALSFSHLTVTSPKGAVRPAWTNIGEEGLTQGFIHIIPAVTYRPVSNFTLTLGLRLGIANIFDPGNAKESSSSWLNSDIALSSQFMFRIDNQIKMGIDWVEGLTYYDYFEQQDPNKYYSFFKYRSFIILCQYDLYSKKHS